MGVTVKHYGLYAYSVRTILVFCMTGFTGFSQDDQLLLNNPYSTSKGLLINRNDTIVFIYRNACKAYSTSWLLLNEQAPAQTERTQQPIFIAETKTPFLRIHGNVQYDFIYRSFIDTPFSNTIFSSIPYKPFLV